MIKVYTKPESKGMMNTEFQLWILLGVGTGIRMVGGTYKVKCRLLRASFCSDGGFTGAY